MLYPIGIQDFENIRKDGYVYVDKTELVYKLTHGSGKSYDREDVLLKVLDDALLLHQEPPPGRLESH